jgi:hypothetical protein
MMRLKSAYVSSARARRNEEAVESGLLRKEGREEKAKIKIK